MKKVRSNSQKIHKKARRFYDWRIRPICLVFFNDLRTIRKSKSALMIIIGLCLLPSLYAWINIYACWDPYANTGNLPIAIVNKDDGAILNDEVINVGDSVVKELKNNKSIGWEFIDEWQGNYGLNNGKYYALIEIPENFSARLVTLTTDHPQKPKITYRVNEKLNSIATKIADAAETKLVNTIKVNFVKTVTEEVINTFKSETLNSGFKTSQIKELKETFEQANNDITKIKGYIDESNTNSENFQQYLNKSILTLPKVNEKISSMQKIIDSTKSLTQTKKQLIESILSNLNTDIQQLNKLDNQNQKLILSLNKLNNSHNNKDTIGIMKECSDLCSSIDIILKSDVKQIKNLNKNYNLSSLDLLADSLNYMDSLVLHEKSALDSQLPILLSDTSNKSISTALNILSGISSEITNHLQKVSNSIQVDCIPLLNNMVNDISIELDNVNSIAELGKSMTPQIGALYAFGGATSKLSVSQAKQLDDMLTTIQDDLNQLISKIDLITSQDIDKLIDLAENNPSEFSYFISSPIDIKEVQVYDANIFGVGLTPFYTVLAIWVGALLSCALLTVECKNTINGVKLTIRQKHFGKMLLFLLLSLVQSTIITLGDVLILGVKPAEFGLLLGISVLTSVTFTVIIYTLVSLWGNVGKAIAVVMMVFQIAGAGGIYPIQTNPKIFGMLEPLWPFTYAIDGFREAIAGPVWGNVEYNALALLIFIVTFILLSVLKKPFHKLNVIIEKKYKEAQI